MPTGTLRAAVSFPWGLTSAKTLREAPSDLHLPLQALRRAASPAQETALTDPADAVNDDDEPPPSDGELLRALAEAGLGSLPERVGGLDATADWAGLLSVGEQQRLAFARALLRSPAAAFLVRPIHSLGALCTRDFYCSTARAEGTCT